MVVLSLGWLSFAPTGCFSTTYDLTSQGAERRQLVTSGQAPDHWYETSFDDSAWTRSGVPTVSVTPGDSGAMPTILIRQPFDVGPDPSSFRKLTLRYQIDGHYVAYVNGQAMATTSSSICTLTLAPGMVTASNNVLALEIHPNTPVVAIDARLQGDAASPDGTALVKGPYLLNPTQNGITIMWQTASDTPSQAIVDGRVFEGGNGSWHSATVTGLEADHAYPYHIEAGATRSEEAQLSTAPPPGKRLRFAVFGDNRSGGDVHRQLVDGLVAEAPDFVINTGDMVGQSTVPEWQTFFNIEYPLMLKTPLFPVMGNHEKDYGQDEMFAQIFPIGDLSHFSGRVYSFDYGSAHLAVLDSNGDLGAQSQWLEGDLAAADARGQRSFLAMHWGPVCGCAGLSHGSNDDANPVLAVATRHRVAAIFSGHNHLYERGVSQGVAYVVTGGGGAPLMSTGQIASTQATFSQNHYVVVDMLGDDVRVTAKTAQGDVLDEAALAVRP